MEFIEKNDLEEIDIYPISIFYVELRDTLIGNNKVSYAPSVYYQSQKMRCMYNYKPSVLI
jgi:hypothetical protein